MTALPPRPLCAQDRTPEDPPTLLDDEALVQFLSTDGIRLGKNFLAWAMRHSISAPDAKDAIQDFLLNIVVRLRAASATSRDIAASRVFLCGRRGAIRKHLRSKRVLPAAGDAALATPSTHQADEVMQAMLAALAGALGRLPEEDQSLLSFCELGGGTQADAARQFGIRQGTVSRRLARARMLLRREIIAALVGEGFDRGELPQ